MVVGYPILLALELSHVRCLRRALGSGPDPNRPPAYLLAVPAPETFQVGRDLYLVWDVYAVLVEVDRQQLSVGPGCKGDCLLFQHAYTQSEAWQAYFLWRS